MSQPFTPHPARQVANAAKVQNRCVFKWKRTVHVWVTFDNLWKLVFASITKNSGCFLFVFEPAVVIIQSRNCRRKRWRPLWKAYSHCSFLSTWFTLVKAKHGLSSRLGLQHGTIIAIRWVSPSRRIWEQTVRKYQPVEYQPLY